MVAVFLLFALLGLVLLLAFRSSAVRSLATRVRFSEQAELLALSALEEARARVASSGNRPGTPLYLFLRTPEASGAAMELVPESTRARAREAGAWPESEVEAVKISMLPLAGEPGLAQDPPYGLARRLWLRLEAAARVDRAVRRQTHYLEARLVNLRPPVPLDRVKLSFQSLGKLTAQQLGGILGRIAVDPGPPAPLASKVTVFYQGDEPQMRASFESMMAGCSTSAAFSAAWASWFLPSARATLAFLCPLDQDRTAMVLPVGIVLCGESLELPPRTRFLQSGVVAAAGDLLLHGVERADPAREGDGLVLAALGKQRRIVLDAAPVEAALLAVGEGSRIEPIDGTTALRVHGLLASSVPSGLLTGALVYDPVQLNGRAEGGYAAPPSPGAPPASPIDPRPSGDLELGAYGFSTARYVSWSRSEAAW